MKKFVLFAFCLLAVSAGCRKTPQGPTVPEPVATVDEFASDVLGSWYLWSEEIAGSLKRLDSRTCTDPIRVVNEIRYHRNGKEIDRWTELMENLEEFSQSVQGLGPTYGYDLQYGQFTGTNTYFLLVTYVAKDSPAQRAGMKRGDILLTINGADITKKNINDAFSGKSIRFGFGRLVEQGKERVIEADKERGAASLTAVDMYEDPILLTRVFDAGGKKVGYLVYNGFDLKSARALTDSCAKLKAAGIAELVLDLRYNGGGYEYTESVLASLLAPPANVAAGDVFQTEVFNKKLNAQFKPEDLQTRLSATHPFYKSNDDKVPAFTVDVSAANPGIRKLYALVSGGTASASEGLLVGLGPYLDITVIGSQTHGKYCAGYMLSPKDFYSEDYYRKNLSKFTAVQDWGIYVMVSKFADKNGNNAAEPDGIMPGIRAMDNPFDGCQLGDENETLLRAALKAAGKVYATRAAEPREALEFNLQPLEHKPNILINNRKIPDYK